MLSWLHIPPGLKGRGLRNKPQPGQSKLDARVLSLLYNDA